VNLAGSFPVPGFSVALEITPPRELRPGILLRRARLLGGLASRVHVIQRPGRMSSLEASLLLADAGFEPVVHVVNRGRAREDIDAELRRARAGGIQRVLCIRGEGDDKDGSTTPRIREVVSRLRDSWPAASVGVTANQYGPRGRVLRNALRKLDAGAGFVQTQPVFEWEVFESLARELKERAPGVAIVAMLMPTTPGAERVARRLGVSMPPLLGWGAFAETLHALRESPLADGVAILTPAIDPDPDFAGALRAALGGDV
jgi:methylenetetrahydrofolate reductase (NADPH)